MDSHYAGILAGYAAASAALWALWFVIRPVIASNVETPFARPWLEIGLVVLAAALTIGVGQLYTGHRLLPDDGVALRTANQALIFAPLLVLVALRPNRFAGAGLPGGLPMLGLLVGVVLAAGAGAVYAFVRHAPAVDVFASVMQADNVPHAAQVLFEDIAIAALLLRLRAAIGPRWPIVIVAALFAASHIPAMLSGGAEISGLTSLVFDTGIGVMVLGGVMATRSIWWFWPVHTLLDLTQFYHGR